jgi:drug/metabolite transporter (DMT)-like permease
MVNAAVVPSLLIAVITALQMIAQKHVAHKLSHQTIFVVSALVYLVLTLFYFGYHSNLIIREVREVVVPIGLVLVSAAVMGFITNLIYFNIIRHNEISLVSAITSVTPLFVAGIAVLILKETLTVSQMIGIVAIVVGTILLT